MHYLYINKAVVRKETNQANHHGHVFERSDTSLRKASGRPFRRYSRGWSGDFPTGEDSSRSVIAPGDLPVGQDMEVEDSDIHDPDSVQTWANVYGSVLVFNKKKSLKSKINFKNLQIEKCL